MERIGDTATGVSVERSRMGARGRQVLVSLSLGGDTPIHCFEDDVYGEGGRGGREEEEEEMR